MLLFQPLLQNYQSLFLFSLRSQKNWELRVRARRTPAFPAIRNAFRKERVFVSLVQLLPHTDPFFDFIAKFFVKGNHTGIGGEHLQIKLETTKCFDLLFHSLHQHRRNALSAKGWADTERIDPAAVPIVAPHD